MKKPDAPAYHAVSLNGDYLAGKALDLYIRRHRSIVRNMSAHQKSVMMEEFRDFISCLQESMATQNPVFLADYTGWLKVYSSHAGRRKDYVPSHLAVLKEVTKHELPPDLGERAGRILDSGIDSLSALPDEIPSFIREGDPCSEIAGSCLRSLIDGDPAGAESGIVRAEDKGVPVRDLYDRVLCPVLDETGRLWQIGKISVAQEHAVTGSVRAIINRLHERIPSEVPGAAGAKRKTVVVACISGETHDIGSLMVADVFRTAGWSTFHTGADSPLESIVAMAGKQHADTVVISITMARHLPAAYRLIRSLRGGDDTAGVKIIVGGRLFDLAPALWKQVGADGCAAGAGQAVETAERLTS